MAGMLNSAPVARRQLLGGMAVAAVPALPAVAGGTDVDLISAFNRWMDGQRDVGRMERDRCVPDADFNRVLDACSAELHLMATLPAHGHVALAAKVYLLLHVMNGGVFGQAPLIDAGGFDGGFHEDVLQRSLLVDVQARFPELRA